MNKNQETMMYYCSLLHSEWAQKKALAYLRLLAEAEGDGQIPAKKTGEGRGQALSKEEGI